MKDFDKITGRLYDIQSFSVHDGPGIRTTVFTKGCPLHCPWCHSPESQAFIPQIGYSSVRCIGTELCGECLRVCPAGAVEPGEPVYSASAQKDIIPVRWDRAKCLGCTACTQVCFPEAMALCGKVYSVNDVLKIVRKDYDFFRSSEGGVTISGGECLSQIDFTEALLMGIKEDGIHTAVDTTGFVSQSAVERVLPYTDLFLYDLKHMNSELHEKTVGVPTEPIHANARYIAEHGGHLQVRIPVIPGFNDTEENLRATAEFCLTIKDAVDVVQLLPFHHYGSSKYERFQMYDPLPADMEAPSDEFMQQCLELFKSYGLNTIIH